VEIYTDGGVYPNPGGAGAWAFVAIADGQVIHKATGGEASTTNNRVELLAIIEALKWAPGPVTIYSDSDLCVRCGLKQWKRKANLDLWTQFDSLFNILKHELVWVRGHSGNVFNEMADKMCAATMKQMREAAAQEALDA